MSYVGSGEANHPDWVPDNDPVSISGVASYTYTLAKSWDTIKVVFTDWSTAATSAEEVQLIIDGDTGTNYDARNRDGTLATGGAKWNIGAHGNGVAEIHGDIIISGRWNETATYQNRTGSNGQSSTDIEGRNTAVASPLGSFTLNTTSNFACTLEVFGRDS